MTSKPLEITVFWNKATYEWILVNAETKKFAQRLEDCPMVSRLFDNKLSKSKPKTFILPTAIEIRRDK